MLQAPRLPRKSTNWATVNWTAALAFAVMLISPIAGADEAQPAGPSPEGVEFFEKHIRPLFAQHCLECHGDKKKGGLALDSQGGMNEGGDSGPVLTPGNPEASLLVQALKHQDEPKMPPEGKLPAERIALVESWIRMGAPWPADSKPRPLGQDPRAAPDKHWAFQPILKPALPQVANSAWPRSPIDHFVLATLEQKGLAPSPSADRRTVARRASFDLLGIPPTFSEVEQFASDPNPLAAEQLADRLLASPSYGVRWARHWLDVARYADTKGYLFTEDRRYPNAYRYRDWVVRALNNDLPYDDFLIQQIAADRAPLAGDNAPLEAMGFLTVGRRFLNNPHDIIDDRIDVLTRGTMALTVSCARCHDHKYDPIPTKDYYSLYGVLASSVEPKEPADVMSLADAPQPVTPRVFVRGNSGNHGDEVPRQFLSVLAGETRQPFQSGSGRLELAQAIASRDNPLTARVIVNRVWMYYFDAPLVKTPSDFGLRSEPPSHPELLDYLAAHLIENDWSLKSLHRLILTSATYQQASVDRPECRAVDPENRLLWRMNRKRLDFEALRDALLAASGQLDPTLGGPGFDLAATPWTTRRTIYGLIDRQNLPSTFRTFDFASPDTHSPQRFTTTVPQQALYLMNSPFVREQVHQLAARAEFHELDPPHKVERLYEVALTRHPRAEELALGVNFLTNEPAGTPSGEQLSVWERYVQVVLLSNEFVFVD